jgi:putative ABC transport system permease protein
MPDWKAEIISRLRDRSAAHEDVLEEMAQHLDQRYRSLLARGRTDAQAYAETMEEANDPAALAATLRAASRTPPLDPPARERGTTGSARRHAVLLAPALLMRDARFGLRLLRRNAAFTAVAVATLALGIAATTAIFSVVYGLFFAPLPYDQPDRLVMVWQYVNGDRLSVSPKSYTAWTQQATSFADINAWSGRTVNVATADRPENVSAGAATPGFLAMLGYGYPLALGRSFQEDEGVPGRDHVVVLTYQFWQERFGGDPGILGRQVRVNDEPYTVVGVLGKGPADRQQNKIWLPLAFTEADLQSDAGRLYVMARLKDGVTIAQANASMTTLGARLEQERPRPRSGWTVQVEAFRNDFVAPSTVRGLWLLFGAVLFVLLIACANVANLLLARGTTRHRELAIRAAMGATRSAVARQLLVETLVLAMAGGLLGAWLASAIVHAVVALMPPFTLPSETEITLSVPVLLFALAACTVSGVVAGLAPAWQASRTSAADTMREGGRTIGDRRFALRRGLVILEFALALTLLAGGGLAVHAWVRQMTADLGFRADHLTTFSLPVPRGRLTTTDQMRTFYGSLADRIAVLPGVEAASVSTGMPVSGAGYRGQFEIAGDRVVDPEKRPWTSVIMATASYHETFGIAMHRGRAFAETDREGSRPVAIVNETFAQRFLAGRDPIGRHLVMAPPANVASVAAPIDWEIVGVQADAANAAPGRPVVAEIVLPFAQNPWSTAIVAVRTIGDASVPWTAIADVLRTIDPTIPMARVQTIEQTLSRSMASDRFYTAFFVAFAGIGLVLAVVGIYGVMSFAVAQRTHEIGLRMALGGSRRHVVGRILREGMTTALAGTVLGAIGAVFVGRLLQGAVYGIEPSNPLPFIAVGITLLLAAFVACVVPARRAAAVDPIVALRQN